MMLDLPGVVVAEPVGELDLGERVLQQLVFAPGAPRPRQLVLVEDAELHVSLPTVIPTGAKRSGGTFFEGDTKKTPRLRSAPLGVTVYSSLPLTKPGDAIDQGWQERPRQVVAPAGKRLDLRRRHE